MRADNQLYAKIGEHYVCKITRASMIILEDIVGSYNYWVLAKLPKQDRYDCGIRFFVRY